MNTQSHEVNADPAGLAQLLAPYRPLHVRYAGDELICREGTFAAGMQWITQGLVLETESPVRRGPLSTPPDLLVPGDALGIEILVPAAEERHRTTCRALTEVSLVFLDRTSLDQALVEDSKFAALLVGHLAVRHVRLRRARSRLRLDPASRLQAMLLDLCPVCELVEGENALALPEAIDARILGELSGLSPAQMKRLLPEVTQTRDPSGRIVFRPDEFPTAANESRELRRQSVS